MLDINKMSMLIFAYTSYLSYYRGCKQNIKSVLGSPCFCFVHVCGCMLGTSVGVKLPLFDLLWHRFVLCLVSHAILDVMVSTWESLFPSG